MSRDIPGIVGAISLTIFGLFFLYFGSGYRMGTILRMGPGYYPSIIGIAITLSGLILLARSLRTPGGETNVDWRPLIFISASMISFALFVDVIGLFFTSIIATGLASLSSSDLSLGNVALLALAIATFVVLLFAYGLGLSIPVIGAR